MRGALRAGGLAALLVLLAALAWRQGAGAWAWPGAAWQPPAAQPPQLESVLAVTLAPHPGLQGGRSALLQRPLFHMSRRPPPPPAPPKAPVAPPAQAALDKLRLLGVLDSAALAGVMARIDDETRFLKRGDQVGDWTLTDIRGRQVTFASRGEQRVLELPHAHTALAAGPAAPVTRSRRP